MVTLYPLPDLATPLDDIDRGLIQAIQQGLPLVSRPYAAIAADLGVEESELLRRLQRLLDTGVIRRLGVVVRHHELGYRANAMVVWDIPDAEVDELGHRLGGFPGITLCYRRPRRLPHWPYNLFTMIHGRDRDEVLDRLARLLNLYDLGTIPHEVLFSRRRFKQRGARYDVTVRTPRPLAGEGEGVRAKVSITYPLTLALSPSSGGEGTERLGCDPSQPGFLTEDRRARRLAPGIGRTAP